MIILFRMRFPGQKNVISTCLVLLVLLLAVNQAKSQDVPLMQFNYSPLLLNPANTGNFYGDWRAGLNYRNQWASTGAPYKTMVLSGDKLFNLFNQKIGAGALIISDQSDGINRTKIYASGSYFYKLNENHFSAGLQAGAIFATPNKSDYHKFDPQTGQNTAPSGETVVIESSKYFDMNIGVLWHRNIGIFEPEVGLSYTHLTHPNESFTRGTSKVNPTTSIHASAKTKINDEIYLLPTFLIANFGGITYSVVGTDVGYNLLGNRSSVKKIFGGLYVRNGLAAELSDFTVLIGTTVGRLDIALNYDINVSGMSKTKSNSSFEISLIYKSISTILNSYSIPCERF